MARNGTDLIVKSNSKLEAFLKRNLDVDTYEKIRAHDSVIVCSEKENKAFKYIILTDEWIYLTENPPKNVYETVHLKDLVSVDLVNDYPVFLQGDDQTNVQHLVIKYLSNEPVKRKKGKSGRKEKESGGDLLDTSRSLGDTPVTPRSLPATTPRSLPVNPIIKPYLRSSLLAADTKEMKVLTARQILNNSSPGQFVCLSSSRLDTGTEKRVQFGDSSVPVITTSRSTPSEPVSPILKRKTSPDVEKHVSGKWKSKNKKRSSSASPRVSSSNKLTPRIKGELQIDLTQLQSEGEDGENEGDENSNDLKRPENNPSEDTITSTNGEEICEVVMDVYVMNSRSKMLMLIQSAKHNYLMRGTLEEDPKYLLKTTVMTPRSLQNTSDKLEYLFRQLKTELQYTSNTMEENFTHVHELKVATEKNFALRKLFWKTPEVFIFMIRQLRIYLPMSKTRMKRCQTDDDFKIARADELEYLVLLLETLAILFRETEIVPTRLLMLKAEAGRITQQLTQMLVSTPEVPPLSHAVPDKVRILQNTSDILHNGSQADDEVHKLLMEYRKVSTSVLFELLMIGQQANWLEGETALLNVNWVVRQLGEPKTLEPFVEHLIAEAIGALSSRRLEPLSPAGVVLLYQQFHVLQTLTYFSTETTDFIRQNFLEEFKYYIQPSVLDRKLPSIYVLRPSILTLMERVVGDVLEQHVNLSTKFDV